MELSVEIKEQIKSSQRRVNLKDGTAVPQMGQGTWHIGESRSNAAREADALRLGIELGMTLIDTAEMYAEGVAESVVGEAITGRRDGLFIVSKVYPHNAGRRNIARSCENSLRRLKTDRIDLYLLHWRGSVPLKETIEGMEDLIAKGRILRWGVSNFDTDDMQELFNCAGGSRCATNQVLYHLGSRGVEFDLLPFQNKQRMPLMAYCPIAQAGSLRRELLSNRTVCDIASARGVKPLQIALSWCVRTPNVIAIPKASSPEHVLENARAAAITLTQEELAALDAAFPPPRRKMMLDMQ